jgi:hypothetical protein
VLAAPDKIKSTIFMISMGSGKSLPMLDMSLTASGTLTTLKSLEHSAAATSDELAMLRCTLHSAFSSPEI